MSEPTCDRCTKPIHDMFEDPPTCNRCLLLGIIEAAVEQSTCRDCTPDDVANTADAILAIFDNAYEQGNESLIREYLTQTGWR